jgi:hypothetical protein
MLRNLTDQQIEARIDVVERWIVESRDAKSLPALNDIFQKLIDEQARRDVEREEMTP